MEAMEMMGAMGRMGIMGRIGPLILIGASIVIPRRNHFFLPIFSIPASIKREVP
jgi:hypothetical protein